MDKNEVGGKRIQRMNNGLGKWKMMKWAVEGMEKGIEAWGGHIRGWRPKEKTEERGGGEK